VAENGDEISVETYTHTSGLIAIRLKVGPLYSLPLVINTGYLISCVRPGVRDSLVALGHLRPSGGRFYELHDIALAGRAMPPLEMRVNAAIALLDMDGVVGLNFLSQFREVCFDVETRRLTLRS
jgi:hypothetical protein